jgi:RimJ/RimL family protein N-acetyltransferase
MTKKLLRNFKAYGIELNIVDVSNLITLRNWRNNPEIRSKMADDGYISPHQHRMWYENHVMKSNNGYWIVRYKNTPVGYIQIKIDKITNTVEPGSFLVDSPVRHALLGYALILVQLDISFYVVKAKKSIVKIRSNNIRAIRFSKQFGYIEDSVSGEFSIYKLCYADYSKAKQSFTKFFTDTDLTII